MALYGANALIAALSAFLEDGSDGYNVQLAALAPSLPTVQQFAYWTHNSKTTRNYPYLSAYCLDRGAELEHNLRVYEYSVEMNLVLLDGTIAGGEVELLQAAWLYADVMQRMWNRRTPAGREGYTLNNGGIGSPSRVRAATLDRVRIGEENLETRQGNLLVQMRATVSMIETW